MRKRVRLLALLLALTMVIGTITSPAINVSASSEPYYSGSGISDEYSFGDTMKFLGTVYGDGGTIEKIYAHYYDPYNTNDCGEIATEYPYTSSYRMSKLGSYTVGEDIMFNETTYVVKVWGKNEGGTGVLLYETEVTITAMEEPGEFDFTNISSGDYVDADSSLTIKWSSSSNAEYYKVSLVNRTEGTEIIPSTKNGTSRSYKIAASDLEPGMSYRFYVTAYNDAEYWGTYVNFKTEEDTATPTPVPAPYITSVNIATSVTMGDTFSLSGTIKSNGGTLDVVHVNTYLASNSNYCYELYRQEGIGTTSFKLSTLDSYTVGKNIFEKAGTYRLYVWAKNVGGDSEIMVSMEIEVKEKTPTVPPTSAPSIKVGSFDITCPADDVTVSADAGLIVMWTESDNANYYKYAISDITSGLNDWVVSSTQTYNTSTVIPAGTLKAGHEYVVCVTAYYDESTYVGEKVYITAAVAPTTAPITPVPPTKTPVTPKPPTVPPTKIPVVEVGSFDIICPADETTVSADAGLILSWTEADNANYYHYAIADITTGLHDYVVPSVETTETSHVIPAGVLTAGRKYVVYVTAYYDENTYVGEKVYITADEAPTTAPVTPKPPTTAPVTPKPPTVPPTKTPTVKVGSFDIICPVDDAVVSAEAGLILMWTEAENAKYYKYAVSDITSGWNNWVLQSKKTYKTSVTIPAGTLTEGHKYVVCVTAYYDESTYLGEKVYITADVAKTTTPITSAPITVPPTETSKLKVGSFEILTPVDDKKVSTEEELVLSWTEADNAYYYKYAIADITTGLHKYVVPSKVTNKTSIVIPANTLTEGRKYVVYVTAYYDESTYVGEKVYITTGEAPVTPEPPTPAPGYTFVELKQTMYAKADVNVRNLPSTRGDKLGVLKKNDKITVTGRCVETGWYCFSYKGQTAYVSGNYVLVDTTSPTVSVTEPPTKVPVKQDNSYEEEYRAFAFSELVYYPGRDKQAETLLKECVTGNKTVNEYLDVLKRYGILKTVIKDSGTFDTELYLRTMIGECIILDYQPDTWNGFTAIACLNPYSNSITISYGGTNFLSLDTIEDIIFATTDWLPLQFSNAIGFYDKIVLEHGKGKNINLTGHSLGGALAMYVCAYTNSNTITVNGANGVAWNNIILDAYRNIDERIARYPDANVYNKVASEWNCTNYLTDITWNVLNNAMHSFGTKYTKGIVLPYENENELGGHHIFSFMIYNADTKRFRIPYPTGLGGRVQYTYPNEDLANPYSISDPFPLDNLRHDTNESNWLCFINDTMYSSEVTPDGQAGRGYSNDFIVVAENNPHESITINDSFSYNEVTGKITFVLHDTNVKMEYKTQRYKEVHIYIPGVDICAEDVNCDSDEPSEYKICIQNSEVNIEITLPRWTLYTVFDKSGNAIK